MRKPFRGRSLLVTAMMLSRNCCEIPTALTISSMGAERAARSRSYAYRITLANFAHKQKRPDRRIELESINFCSLVS